VQFPPVFEYDQLPLVHVAIESQLKSEPEPYSHVTDLPVHIEPGAGAVEGHGGHGPPPEPQLELPEPPLVPPLDEPERDPLEDPVDAPLADPEDIPLDMLPLEEPLVAPL
jgi:hypothetical protein